MNEVWYVGEELYSTCNHGKLLQAEEFNHLNVTDSLFV